MTSLEEAVKDWMKAKTALREAEEALKAAEKQIVFTMVTEHP